MSRHGSLLWSVSRANSRTKNTPFSSSLAPNVSFSAKNVYDDLDGILNPTAHSSGYSRFTRRAPSDMEYAQADFEIPYLDEGLEEKYKTRDYDDMPETHPSFTNFKIPLEIISHQRYLQNVLDYEKQFRKEIQNLIDFQSSALEASCFVRIMSYTTFWPPLHNRHELEHTSNNFFQLTPSEKSRLNYIMSTEFR